MKNCDIFPIFAQNIDCGSTLEPLQLGGSNEPTINVLEQKIENNVYPCKPHSYYIKVGCEGVFITWTCLHDAISKKKCSTVSNEHLKMYCIT